MTTIAPDTGSPAGILRLGNAFCDAKAVLTAAGLDLFTALSDGPAEAPELRDRLGLHGRGLADLLDLLAALGVLHRGPDRRFRNSAGSQRHLVRGAAGYVGPTLEHADRVLYPAWADLAGALRTGQGAALADLDAALAMAEHPAAADGILRVGHAFRDCQALLTAAELDLFTALAAGPVTEGGIRDRLGLAGPGLGGYLRLLAALGLVCRQGERYAATPDAGRYLVAGQPGNVTGFLRGMGANLYPLWGGLADTLRTGKPQAGETNFAAMLADRAELDRYVSMMDGLIQVVGPRLVERVDWSGHGTVLDNTVPDLTVLDVGGCRGNLAGQIAKAHPELAVTVFDLPQLEPVFDEYVGGLGLADRVSFHAGDFFRDPLPAADVVVFGHVLHNWTFERRKLLVGKAFAALRPGGRLLVHDRMLDAERSNVDNLLASLIMALVTEDGAEYPTAELAALARQAGFSTITQHTLDENETLMVCEKE